MTDILVILMGILDIAAGILIAFAFHFSTFAVVFAVLMVLKGAMSLTSFN
jgi:hypothetical protein